MKKIEVIIADTDIDYSRALAKALATKETGFKVVLDFNLLSGESNPLLGLSLDNDTLLLVDSESKEMLAGTGGDNKQIIGLQPIGREGTKRTGFINKYEGLAGILEDLWMLSGRDTGYEEFITPGRVSRLIGVTGGAGGTGKTSIAIALGREFRLFSNSASFYVSFENATATEQYFPPFGGEQSLNDLLYYLHTENLSHIADRKNVFLIKDAFGLETFRSSDGINELAIAQVEMVRKLLEQVFRWKEYEYIILDFQLEASKRCHWLLSSCDYVLAVDEGACVPAKKTQLLLHHWQQRTGTDSHQSLLFVHNKWNGDAEEGITTDSKHHFIDFDPESFHRFGDRMEIEMDRRFGMGVKNIAATIRKGN